MQYNQGQSVNPICIHHISIKWPQTLATGGLHSSWDMCHVTA